MGKTGSLLEHLCTLTGGLLERLCTLTGRLPVRLRTVVAAAGCVMGLVMTVWGNQKAVYLSEMNAAEYVEIADYSRIPVTEEQAEDDTLLEQAIGDYLIENSSMLQELPEGFVQRNEDNLSAALVTYALQYGASLKDFMKYYAGSEPDTYLEDIHDMAYTYCRKLVIMQRIADEEDLNLSDEELETAIAGMAAQAGFSSPEDYEETVHMDREEQREILMGNRVLKYLAGQAVLVEEEKVLEKETGE